MCVRGNFIHVQRVRGLSGGFAQTEGVPEMDTALPLHVWQGKRRSSIAAIGSAQQRK
jgi:hypothetical protein